MPEWSFRAFIQRRLMIILWSKTAILAHMRTGKCRLKFYQHAVEADDSDLCGCGQTETIKACCTRLKVMVGGSRELKASLGEKDDGATCHIFCRDGRDEKATRKNRLMGKQHCGSQI